MMGRANLDRAFDPTPAPSYNVRHMALSTISWQDVQHMPEDGNRYEAIEGDLYMTPAPTVRHQRVMLRIYRALHEILQEAGHGEVLCAPLGVEFPATGEGVQPDLLFVSHERRGIIADAWLVGAPDLVVEILSPSTSARDRGIKRRLYERQGVREYWIVDPENDAVDVWSFEDEPSHRRVTDVLTVAVGSETAGEVDLGDVFSRE